MCMYPRARRVLTGARATNKWLSVVTETSFLPLVAINCLLMAPRGRVAFPPHTIGYDGANLVEVTIATIALWELQKRHIQETKFYSTPVYHSCPRSCWSEANPKRWTLVVIFGCSPEMNDQTLLLKTLQTLVKERREIKLELTRKIPPSWLAFIIPERVLAKCRGEKSSMA